MTDMIRISARMTLSAMLAAVFLHFGSVQADEKVAVTDAQKSEIEEIVRQYILDNPEIIVEAVRKYQEQQRMAEAEQQRARLAELKSQLEDAPLSPVGGNPDGDVTLVEFFDYRCGYCKRVHDTVVDTVAADGNVRLVYKEFPILGPESVFAARAALAVHFSQPEKYKSFNDALMKSRGSLSNVRVFSIAESIGIDPKALTEAMGDPRVEQEINHNMAIAEALRINGTPAFVIRDTVVPGAVDADTLKSMIAEARQG